MLRYVTVALLAGGLVAGGAVTAAVTATGSSTAPVAASAPRLSTVLLSSRGTGGARATRGTPGTHAVRGTRGSGTSRGTHKAIAPATSPMSSTVPDADGDGFGAGLGRSGRGGFGGFAEHGRGGLTVTSVKDNTIAATGRGGQAVSVQVSATTVYTEAGASASLGDIKPGSIIAVQGSVANTAAATINATAVIIVLPQVSGVVTNVAGSTLTVTQFDGTPRTVTLTGSTRYQKAGQTATQTDIASGTALLVEGTANADGSLTAVRVTIQVPRIAGLVTAVNGTTFTVAGRFGQSYTVTTSGTTTYVGANGATATSTAVQKGVVIVAEGSLSSDGKTLTAQRIIVAPAEGGRGFGHRGGFGQHGGGGWNGGADGFVPGAPSTSTSTSGTGTGSV